MKNTQKWVEEIEGFLKELGFAESDHTDRSEIKPITTIFKGIVWLPQFEHTFDQSKKGDPLGRPWIHQMTDKSCLSIFPVYKSAVSTNSASLARATTSSSSSGDNPLTPIPPITSPDFTMGKPPPKQVI
ncbi:hypothetical protein C7460_10616 [Marinoscillum furvescens DSM 4134]|uniref:Uncharacterized protein n=1 Tax=Marinoscillum furvescens DSM 4134 TaxID=1122208 RepID=A0A3D9L3Q0_MARFU|nr:hypothetical protein C7460_10616 [Marinoscillum furvescens DSM 4134]